MKRIVIKPNKIFLSSASPWIFVFLLDMVMLETMNGIFTETKIITRKSRSMAFWLPRLFCSWCALSQKYKRESQQWPVDGNICNPFNFFPPTKASSWMFFHFYVNWFSDCVTKLFMAIMLWNKQRTLQLFLIFIYLFHLNGAHQLIVAF